jgi:hypothetical protein
MNVYSSLLGKNQRNAAVNIPLQQCKHSFLCGLREVYITPATNITIALPCGGGVEYLHRDPASRRKGSLISETVKYGRESQETRTRERLRWQEPAAYTKDRPILSSGRAPHKSKTVIVK